MTSDFFPRKDPPSAIVVPLSVLFALVSEKSLRSHLLRCEFGSAKCSGPP